MPYLTCPRCRLTVHSPAAARRPASERAALGEALLFLGEELAAIAGRARDARRALASGEASTGTTALGVIEQRAGDAVHHAERLLGGSQLSRAGGEPSSEAAAS